MTIPKQPRPKSEVADDAPTRSEAAAAKQDAGELLQQLNKSYWEQIQAAQLDAQKDYVQAVLNYVEALQREQEKSARMSGAGYWKEVWDSYQSSPQSVADLQRNYWLAALDQHTSSQKALSEAATAYSQRLREISEKLQSLMERQNTAVASSLKDILLRLDVRPADIPTLNLLYHGLRTMSFPQTGPMKSF